MCELSRGDVDRDGQTPGDLELLVPGDQLRARLFAYEFVDLDDEPGLFRERDELRGWDQSAVGMQPADERLHFHDCAGGQVDDGLVVHGQLVARKRSPELALEFQAPPRPHVHRRLEGLVSSLPEPLGLV